MLPILTRTRPSVSPPSGSLRPRDTQSEALAPSPPPDPNFLQVPGRRRRRRRTPAPSPPPDPHFLQVPPTIRRRGGRQRSRTVVASTSSPASGSAEQDPPPPYAEIDSDHSSTTSARPRGPRDPRPSSPPVSPSPPSSRSETPKRPTLSGQHMLALLNGGVELHDGNSYMWDGLRVPRSDDAFLRTAEERGKAILTLPVRVTHLWRVSWIHICR